jgi:hypothetical protein
MKQYFEWIKATPDNLPKELFLQYITIDDKEDLYLCSVDIQYNEEVYHGTTGERHHNECESVCKLAGCYKIVGKVKLKPLYGKENGRDDI